MNRCNEIKNVGENVKQGIILIENKTWTDHHVVGKFISLTYKTCIAFQNMLALLIKSEIINIVLEIITRINK